MPSTLLLWVGSSISGRDTSRAGAITEDRRSLNEPPSGTNQRISSVGLRRIRCRCQKQWFCYSLFYNKLFSLFYNRGTQLYDVGFTRFWPLLNFLIVTSIQITRRTMEEWHCNPRCNTWKKWATYWTDRCWTGTWRSTWILLSYLHLAVNWCRGNVSSLISLNNFCEHTILPVRSVSCLHMNLKPQMTRKLKRLNKKKKASRCLGQGRAKGGENERTPTEGSWWSDSSRTAMRDVWREENDLVLSDRQHSAAWREQMSQTD